MLDDDTKAAAATDFAAGLQDFANGPAADAITVPLTVDQRPRKPKPPLAPNRQVECERICDAKGVPIGIKWRALPGNALVEGQALFLIKDGKLLGFKNVTQFTEPRRGRQFRSQRRSS
jgi:hypothetical protein